MKKTALALFAALVVSGCSSDETGTGGGGGQGGGGEPPPVGPVSGAVANYIYTFDLTTRHAAAQVDVDVTTEGDCFTLALEPPLSGEVSWNGETAANVTADGQTLTACGKGVRAGEPLTIVAAGFDVPQKTFLGLDVGLSVSKDLAGGDFTYLLSWVEGCGHVGLCDPAPDRLSTYHIEVSHPQGSVVLCPGARATSDTSTSCALKDTLAPTYSAFGIASDPLWVESSFVTAAGVEIVFYEVPGGALQTSLSAANVSAFFTWITGLLGPYPYGPKLRFAGGPTTWLGFEHPANVILYEHLPSLTDPYTDSTMHVLMHETVHQWAGDRTTLASTHDFVWKEATAEYLAYVFEDEQGAPGDALATRSYWTSVSLLAQHFPRPLDMPPPALQTFYGDVYGPGPVVLYLQLEGLFGRAPVLAAIQSFLADQGARSVNDLKAALEASTGKDLSAYFDAWVFGAGAPEWPTFQIATSQVGDQVTVTVTQQNASKKVYPCKVEVLVAGATQSTLATVTFAVDGANAAASAVVTLAEPVVSTTLDPDHRIIGRSANVPLALDPALRVYPL